MAIATDADEWIDIYTCERLAQDLNGDSWFIADFPVGPTRCEWLDPYMGLVRVDTPAMRKGFMTVSQLDEMFPGLRCTRPQLTD